jgi:hypothetical protein
VEALPEARRQRAAKKNRQGNLPADVVTSTHDLPGLQRNQIRLWRNVWFIVATSLMLLGAWGLFAWYFALPGGGYIRSDPFGLDKNAALADPIEFLFSMIPNPELSRMPVLPGGRFGALSIRPMPSAFVNSPDRVVLATGTSGKKEPIGVELATRPHSPAVLGNNNQVIINDIDPRVLKRLILVVLADLRVLDHAERILGQHRKR